MNPRTITIGDIHGEYVKLKSLLSLCNFDYENDTLIQLGDVVDRGPKPFECIFELLKIKNLQLIQGNHDWCFLEWIKFYGSPHPLQGGCGSSITMKEWYLLDDYERTMAENFFYRQRLSLIDSKNRLFVHAGINLDEEFQIKEDLLWNRRFFMYLMSCQKNKIPKKLQKWNEIYVGHNASIHFKCSPKGVFSENNSIKKLGTTLPINIHNVWNLDTGCGFEGGVLTAMDIDTKEIWQI
jgi:serine/threonine protein phosphatase 1